MLNFIDMLFVGGVVFCIYLIIRVLVAYNYSMYWISVIYRYKLHCISTKESPIIDYCDIRNMEDFMWDVYTFNKNKIIKNEEKLKVLKDFLNPTA